MQNKYVGDIGDFGKYGLLRHLTGMTDSAAPGDPLRLGVVWYLYPDETPKDPEKPKNRDGNLTGYLCNTRDSHESLRACDPQLFWMLRRLVRECNRNVFSVRMSGILPYEAAYYGQILSYPSKESPSFKKRRREQWLSNALAGMSEADIVFVDPDNGITETIRPLQEKGPKYAVMPWHKKGSKYVFMDDLRQFYKQRKSLIIYHHIARWDEADNQIRYFAKRLQDNLGLPSLPWALRYRRGTTRAYFVVAHEDHEDTIKTLMKNFLDSPWCAAPFRHFKEVH